jgi:RNase P subunit RPR2
MIESCIFLKKGGKMVGYCVKCRAKREISNEERTVMKNGRPAVKGTCPVCGTKMYRIIKK